MNFQIHGWSAFVVTASPAAVPGVAKNNPSLNGCGHAPSLRERFAVRARVEIIPHLPIRTCVTFDTFRLIARHDEALAGEQPTGDSKTKQ